MFMNMIHTKHLKSKRFILEINSNQLDDICSMSKIQSGCIDIDNAVLIQNNIYGSVMYCKYHTIKYLFLCDQ